MAQGKFKARQKLPGKTKAKRKNTNVPKHKGRGVIAPKKAKLREQHQFKKGIEIAMRSNVESEAVSKASVAEPKSLHLINQPSQDSAPSK